MRTVVGAGVFFAGSLLGTSSHAATIDFDFQTAPCSTATDTCSMLNGSLTLSLTATSDNGSNPHFDYKTVGPEQGMGVTASTNDRTGGEIDTNEQITATISTGLALDSFRLLFIYNGPEYADPREIAQVTINKGLAGEAVGVFQVGVSNDTGSWLLNGLPFAAAISNCGHTDDFGAGCFDIGGAFGTALIKSISFTAISSSDKGQSTQPYDVNNDSDYSLGNIKFTAPTTDTHGDVPVPEPASMLLLGTGLMGLGGAARRRFRKN